MSDKYNYGLKCIECGKTYSHDEVRYVCPECSKKQEAYNTIRGVLEIEIQRPLSFAEENEYSVLSFLPVDIRKLNHYPVGNTPFIKSDNLCSKYGFKHLYIKDDGKNPTNSLKDRASILVTADALRRGERKIATASTGNAASSLAGVCAYAGCDALIFVPAKAPIGKLIQIMKYGATIIPVNGTYDDAFELCGEYCAKNNICNRNTAYNPMTTEGKKTVGLEIYRDLGYKSPDYIFVPVGDGSIISGVAKAFRDLKKFGYISRLPKLVGVQAEGSNSIFNGFDSGFPEKLVEAQTIADSISVSAPRNGIRAIYDIKECEGYCVMVTDKEILQAQSVLGKTSGIFAEPAASASLAGFISIHEELDPNTNIVLLSTGDGLKDIKSASGNISIPDPIEPNIDAVEEYLSRR